MTLEELLNSLIQRGWKPFGKDIKKIVKNRLFLGYVSETPVPLSTLECKFSWVLRELVSKESGLWQFVCENGMVKGQKEEKLIEIYDNLRGRTETVYDDEKYEYRLIEASLKDESELEDFLLNSIKID